MDKQNSYRCCKCKKKGKCMHNSQDDALTDASQDGTIA